MNLSNVAKKGKDIPKAEPLLPKDPPPVKSKTAKIVPERCYIRSKPSMDGVPVGVVSMGATFKVIDGSTKDFTAILYNDVESFVKTDCVEIY